MPGETPKKPSDIIEATEGNAIKEEASSDTLGKSAYQLAQEGWKELLRAPADKLLGEEKERGITIASA